MTQPSLTERMRKLAPGHDRESDLKKLADELDAANNANPFDPRKLLGCWARAKRLWYEITGESLI